VTGWQVHALGVGAALLVWAIVRDLRVAVPIAIVIGFVATGIASRRR